MADAFYNQIASGVSNPLLDQFGQAASLREVSGETFDGKTGFVTGAGVTTDHAVTVAIFDIKEREKTGTNVEEGTKKILMSPLNPNTGAALSVVPDTSMQLIANSTTYAIVSVEQVAPGGVVVLYKIMAKR